MTLLHNSCSKSWDFQAQESYRLIFLDGRGQILKHTSRTPGLGDPLSSPDCKLVSLQGIDMKHHNLTSCWFSKSIVQFQELNSQT